MVILTVMQETTCKDKDGWCISDIQEKCRGILAVYVKELMNTDESPATVPQQQQTAASSKGSTQLVNIISPVSSLGFVVVVLFCLSINVPENTNK